MDETVKAKLILDQSLERNDSFSLHLPQNPAAYSLTAQAILEELRVQHRRLEMYGSAEITPSMLLSVDSLPELLAKQVQLTESHKTTSAISEAILELAGLVPHLPEPTVYFYPYFVNVGSEPILRMGMVSPQNKEQVDITPYRRAFFRYSLDILDTLFLEKTSFSNQLPVSNPGSLLLSQNATGDMDIRFQEIGFEKMLDDFIRVSMKPYPSLPVFHFRTDVISYGKDKAKLIELIPGYHVPFIGYGQGNFIFLSHLVVQWDALWQYADVRLRSLALKNGYNQFYAAWENFIKSIPHDTESIQSKILDLSLELVHLLELFPWEKLESEIEKEFRDKIRLGTLILKKLRGEIHEQKQNQIEEELTTLEQKISETITQDSKERFVLSKINLNQEIQTITWKTEAARLQAKENIKKRILQNFGAVEVKFDDVHVLFAIDPRFYSKIKKQLEAQAKENPKRNDELKILAQIHSGLLQNGNPNLDKEPKVVSSEIESPGTTETENSRSETKWKDWIINQQSNLNLPVAIGTTLFLSVSVTILALTMGRLDYILSGVPLGFCFGIGLGYLLRKDSLPKKNPVSLLPKDQDFRPSQFAKLVEPFVYPKKFNTLQEKVYDSVRLRTKLEESLDEILPLLKLELDKDQKKILVELEHAVLSLSASIRIPQALQMKGRPKELIVSKADLRTVWFRNNLADYYRKELSVFKSDPAQLSYLQFLIREIEFGYNKYLKT